MLFIKGLNSEVLHNFCLQFVLCSTLHVATGEESEEKKLQSSRNARMLEAHYPRFSAIPPR